MRKVFRGHKILVRYFQWLIGFQGWVEMGQNICQHFPDSSHAAIIVRLQKCLFSWLVLTFPDEGLEVSTSKFHEF